MIWIQKAVSQNGEPLFVGAQAPTQTTLTMACDREPPGEQRAMTSGKSVTGRS